MRLADARDRRRPGPASPARGRRRARGPARRCRSASARRSRARPRASGRGRSASRLRPSGVARRRPRGWARIQRGRRAPRPACSRRSQHRAAAEPARALVAAGGAEEDGVRALLLAGPSRQASILRRGRVRHQKTDTLKYFLGFVRMSSTSALSSLHRRTRVVVELAVVHQLAERAVARVRAARDLASRAPA